MDLPMHLFSKLLKLATLYPIADEILYQQSVEAFSASKACHSGRAVQSADPNMPDSQSSMRGRESQQLQHLELDGSPTHDLYPPSSHPYLAYSL